MDKDRLLNYLPLTAILIIFLYVNSILYLFAFWSLYSIDIFQLITITDIPKYFVVPFLLSSFALVFLSLNNNTLILRESIHNGGSKTFIEINEGWSERKRLYLRFLLDIDLWFTFLATYSLFFYENDYKSSLTWYFVPLIIAYYFTYRVSNLYTVKKIITDLKFRSYLIAIIFFVPAVSLYSGRRQSLDIFNNKQIKYIDLINKDGMSLDTTKKFKLIGFIDENVIYADTNNSNYFIVDKNDLKAIRIYK